MTAPDDTIETRAQFLARVSHELLTPLNAVIGFSRVLEQNRAGNQRPQDLDMLRRVRGGGEHLLRLLTDLLEQTRIANADPPLQLRATDVTPLVQRVLAAHREAAAAKGLRLIARVPNRVLPLPLDPARFEKVLRHLLDNAIKFTRAGMVRVALATDTATGRPRRLSVTDSGIGISSARLQRVFGAFEQAEVGDARSYEGIGLGLTLARTLSERMGCTLSAASEPGKGSRFTIHFPAA